MLQRSRGERWERIVWRSSGGKDVRVGVTCMMKKTVRLRVRWRVNRW